MFNVLVISRSLELHPNVCLSQPTYTEVDGWSGGIYDETIRLSPNIQMQLKKKKRYIDSS